MATSLLKEKQLPNQLWVEAIAIAVYLLNLSPTKAVLNRTPYEAWRGKKPSVDHLRVFGCVAYSLLNSHVHKKLDVKSERCIFIGYCTESKAFKLFNPITNKVWINRDVIFHEDASWCWEKDKATIQHVPLEVHENEISSSATTTTHDVVSSHSPIQTDAAEANSSSTQSKSVSEHEVSNGIPSTRYRSLREIYETCSFALSIADPVTYDEATRLQEWQSAMNEEISSIQRNQTWELTDLPPGKKTVGLKWVFKSKYHSDGSLHKHKARLVAKGYSQKQGVDFEDTFSPVARLETVRTFLALAAQLKWPIFQLDLKSAFLNGDLQEEVFVDQPEGFIVAGSEDKVYRLKKALYGLRQAPRAWYGKVDQYFVKYGFQRSDYEPTLYKKIYENSDMMLVCIYVDDIIYMGSSQALVDEFKCGMMHMFEMTYLGLLQYFIGLEVKQEEGSIFVSQKRYAENLLRRYNMQNCK